MTARRLLLLCIWFGVAGLTALALAAAVAGSSVQTFIETAGVNIPTEDVIADYMWGLAWGCILLAAIFVWPVSWTHKKLLAAGWLIKCFVALVVMLPYEERYYGLDCWYYFQRAHMAWAEIVPFLLRGSSDLVIGIGALHLRVGPDSYHAMKLSFAWIGLVAAYLFYRAAERLLDKHSPFVFWTLILYPSILFWSSILGKDSIVLVAIGLHVWGLANLAVRRRPVYVIAVVCGILAVSAIRIWMGPILIVPCLLVIILRIEHAGWRVASVVLVGLALLGLAPATVDRLSLDKAETLVDATRAVTSNWAANSSLDHDLELNSSWDLVLFVPRGIFDAYVRPLPGDVDNLFGWLAGFENLGLLLVALWAVLRLRLRYLRDPMFFWGAALLLTWGMAYGIVAHKDLGTAVRFKLQVLPVLLGVIGYLLRRPSRQFAFHAERKLALARVASLR